MRTTIFLFFVLLLPLTSFAQNEVKAFFDLTKRGQYLQAQDLLTSHSDALPAFELQTYLSIMKEGNFPEKRPPAQIDVTSRTGQLRLLNNAITLYAKFGDEVAAFQQLHTVLNAAKKHQDSVLVCEVYRNTLEIYERFHIYIEDDSYDYMLKDYWSWAYDTFEKEAHTVYAYRLIQRFHYKQPTVVSNYYQTHWNRLEDISNSFLAAKRDLTHYVYHQDFTREMDSAAYYLKRALHLLENKDGYFEAERKRAAAINRASYLMLIDQPQRALSIFDSLERHPPATNYLFQSLDKFIDYRKALVYGSLNRERDSLIAMNRYLSKELSFNQADNLQVVSEYETKYQTAEKEKQLLIEKDKRTQNRNIAIGLGGGLAAVLLLSVLLFKNSKKKQRIAEQEREIEIQKKEKILKEQELNAIDAMIAGQEKERQRLASDLHDSVGATLSAAKLQFEHLKKNKNQLTALDALFEKTGTLLDEAYTEVRAMAHVKHSGVIAKEGLLPAVEKLAKNASFQQSLRVEVQDFGLTERLEPSLEIAIFRMIQELVTNIIKHANASEATISITQHEHSLSIIVEDNGKGFNASKFQQKEGMGLSSIERRVEFLEGTMEIDATPGKGTTILIDIPI
ncbi:sensor histidine kinase [Altibacter sp. HG106]|uniref:sensor histidine kinase n=1 Tax=Altibacter sp. HG106 TaxID=3023937 RepID=UPI00234FBCF5|nr:sensor histidine kinase [Altibacter sp. HG106]MDC7995775.1 sensor histidine kinase [Altibacter sp. HG106]